MNWYTPACIAEVLETRVEIYQGRRPSPFAQFFVPPVNSPILSHTMVLLQAEIIFHHPRVEMTLPQILTRKPKQMLLILWLSVSYMLVTISACHQRSNAKWAHRIAPMHVQQQDSDQMIEDEHTSHLAQCLQFQHYQAATTCASITFLSALMTR